MVYYSLTADTITALLTQKAGCLCRYLRVAVYSQTTEHFFFFFSIKKAFKCSESVVSAVPWTSLMKICFTKAETYTVKNGGIFTTISLEQAEFLCSARHLFVLLFFFLLFFLPLLFLQYLSNEGLQGYEYKLSWPFPYMSARRLKRGPQSLR